MPASTVRRITTTREANQHKCPSQIKHMPQNTHQPAPIHSQQQSQQHTITPEPTFCYPHTHYASPRTHCLCCPSFLLHSNTLRASLPSPPTFQQGYTACNVVPQNTHSHSTYTTCSRTLPQCQQNTLTHPPKPNPKHATEGILAVPLHTQSSTSAIRCVPYRIRPVSQTTTST